MSNNPADPFALFREALNQWEKAANQVGTQIMSTPQAAEIMHKGTAASMQVQNALKDGMGKALSVHNLPSKADIEALAAQLGGIENRLARMETLLAGGMGAGPNRPQPKRTRTPPVPVP
jgi:hypothetical protein